MVWGRLRFVFIVFFIVGSAFAGSTARAALAVAPQPSPGEAIPSVNTIFNRHHAAVGKLPTLVAHWSGGITDNGQIARYEVTATRDGLYRRTYILPLMKRTEGSNGTLDWEQDENGNVQTSPAAHLAPMDERLVRLNDIRFDPANSSVLGMATIDGRRSYSVSMQVRGSKAIVYFDAATALIDGADFGPNTVRYRAYRRFGGVAVPVEIAETSPDETVTITVDDVDYLQATRGEFDPPAQRMPAFPASSHAVELNFDSPHGLIVCAAHINGHPVRLLIDSGSTTSILNLDLAKQLALPTGGFSRVQGAGMFTGTVARIDSLDLGGIRFEPFFVQAVQLTLPSRIAHEGIDGVLGYDVLAPLVTRISYKHGQIQLMDPATFTYAGTGTIIPIDATKHIPIISASIGKDHTGVFSVDTGSTAALVLYRHFADANHIDFLNPAEHDFELRQPIIFDPNDFGPTMASGAGGDFPTRLAIVDRLNLGSFSLPELLTEIIMREEGAFGSSSSTDGIVGGGSLALFAAVFIDYPNKRLILEK